MDGLSDVLCTGTWSAKENAIRSAETLTQQGERPILSPNIASDPKWDLG